MATIIFWLFVGLILISFSVFTEPNDFLANGTTYLGWVLFIIQLSYNKSDKFNIMINKLNHYIFNIGSYTSVEIKYKVNTNIEIFHDSAERFYNKFEDQVEIFKKVSNCRYSIELDKLKMDLFFDEDTNEIFLEFRETGIGYRDTLHYLEHDVQEVVESFTEIINPIFKDYYLNIRFGKSNPFYGFYLKKLSKEEVVNYHVSIKNSKSFIEIDEKHLNLRSSTQQDFILSAKKYLAITTIN
ncbi:hypothetical protein ACFPYN_02880 [Paenisporosarcina macmurdoensis]|uniref:SMODS-associated NUDIX domain-containing protein n=1 Tax=Paenisporosarcina macmurdoensis TaxID=212659 RepID=A0ABW1L682_9BACL